MAPWTGSPTLIETGRPRRQVDRPPRVAIRCGPQIATGTSGAARRRGERDGTGHHGAHVVRLADAGLREDADRLTLLEETPCGEVCRRRASRSTGTWGIARRSGPADQCREQRRGAPGTAPAAAGPRRPMSVKSRKLTWLLASTTGPLRGTRSAPTSSIRSPSTRKSTRVSPITGG